jgi:hypothetical protein
MNYADALFNETNRGGARTANGALSYAETASGVLDFFSKSGALRGKTQEALRYFGKAMSENSTLALRALFYMRDVRGGQGERDNFRAILEYLARKFPMEISRNMRYVPEFGRWDDLYSFVGTNLQDLALDMLKDQFFKDLTALKSGDNVSILAKWLKSENTSSKESRKLAKITREYFGLTPRKYRKGLSLLRDKIALVETAMSQNKWTKVEYSRVPSQAARIYSNAFRKHDTTRYTQYIEKVHSGEEKINAGTLYPYDIVKNVRAMFHTMKDEIRTYDALWKALPNFATEPENAIAVVDTSGSMGSGSGKVAPIDVALSLGLYFAERNVGPFKDYFITFSQQPSMQKIQGTDIYEKVKNLNNAHWDGNTNLQAVFDLLLTTAIKKNASQEDLPKKIYIISDMQFDMATGNSSYYGRRKESTNFEAIDRKYKEAGYERPQLVFWNVNASSDTPVTKDENGTFLVSGCSPSILKYAVNCIAATPYELMLEVLNSERYSMIA